ncbi:MAG: hypothetical protein HOP19_11920, partial [Acidobacteria bacterium]|nr:hypothetical protein [Acidobacteriota bacterium]
MANDTVFCQGCGITLRPFMSRCPRCGIERPEATPPRVPMSAVEPEAAPAAPNANAPVVTIPLLTSSVSSPATAPAGTFPFRAGALKAEPESLAPPRTIVAPMEGQRRRALMSDEAAVAPPPDTIYMSPPDAVRRFPLFTPSQWTLLIAGLALLVIGLLIGYLVWSREQRDAGGVTITPNATTQTNPSDQTLLPPASPTIDLASPTPELAPMLE